MASRFLLASSPLKKTSLTRFTSTALRRSYSSDTTDKSQNSTPGWKGRKPEDHVVNRPNHDIQTAASHSAMKSKEGHSDAPPKEHSDAISQKDNTNAKQRAKEEFPEAPDAIGMNDERGGRAH